MTDNAPDTGAPTDSSVTEPEPETSDIDWQAEAQKYKALARKQEDRAKANAAAQRELEQLKRESMSDLEKAVDLARAETRTQVQIECGARLVDAEVRAAAAGRIDAETLLEGLDRSRFLTENGEVDREALNSWIERIVPKPEDGFPDLGQGARPTGPTATALNGDPLLRDLKNLLGGPRRR